MGNKRSYLLAVAVTLPSIPLAIWMSQWTRTFKGSTIAPFVGASPSPWISAGVVNYGLLATGFPEELLFRGLIAGTLFRRMRFRKANVLQACIFVLPHLLILLVASGCWHSCFLLRSDLSPDGYGTGLEALVPA